MATTPAVKYKPISDDGFEDVKTDDAHEEYPLNQGNWNSTIYTWAILYYAREVIYKPFCPRLTTPDTVHVWDQVEFNPQLVNPVTPGYDHPLLGNPSPEVDANWSALLSAFANRIPETEVHRLGMETDAIPFNDGEGG
ncbi:hypothetical protein CaCOL14_002508 [Colletotrichum acutatum]